MRRWWLLLVGGCALAAAACAEASTTSPPGPVSEAATATAFTWETTLDQDGYGYELTVEGVVGDDHATYTMHVVPLLADGGGDYADLLAFAAGAAVNGFADEGGGVATSEGDIAADGRTEVRVVGDERWYRNPWLRDEAAFALGDAEWVRVVEGEPVVVDLVTAVLNERYDDALRRLLAAIDAGEPIEAPTPDEQASELDEMLTPWIGLAGPAYPVGAEPTVSGDADEGELSWRQALTSESDGVDGEQSGTVRWSPTDDGVDAPEPPADGDVVDAPDITAALGG